MQYLWTSSNNIAKIFRVSRKTIRNRLEEHPNVRTLRFGDVENGKIFILTEDVGELNLYIRRSFKRGASRRLQKESL
jgi:transcriptional antiterminator